MCSPVTVISGRWRRVLPNTISGFLPLGSAACPGAHFLHGLRLRPRLTLRKQRMSLEVSALIHRQCSVLEHKQTGRVIPSKPTPNLEKIYDGDRALRNPARLSAAHDVVLGQGTEFLKIRGLQSRTDKVRNDRGTRGRYARGRDCAQPARRGWARGIARGFAGGLSAPRMMKTAGGCHGRFWVTAGSRPVFQRAGSVRQIERPDGFRTRAMSTELGASTAICASWMAFAGENRAADEGHAVSERMADADFPRRHRSPGGAGNDENRFRSG